MTQKTMYRTSSLDGVCALSLKKKAHKSKHLFFLKPLFNNLHSQNVWPTEKEFLTNNNLLSSFTPKCCPAKFSKKGIQQDPCQKRFKIFADTRSAYNIQTQNS